ncbi:hypothetical protein CVS37_23795 [Burkholderia lata]|nr:hypothetical protein CVS37_23795 [Burkholderia lata]
MSPTPLVHLYGPGLRRYDTSSSIRGHSKPDRAAQISRIRDVYDEGEQCFPAGQRPAPAPSV